MEQNIEHPGADFLDLPRQEAEEIQAMQIILRMAEAVTQQGGSDYVKLQWIEAWDGILPTTMLGEDSSVLLGL